MGLLITLRDDESISYFKEILIGIIKKNSGGFNRIIISSGYFMPDVLSVKNNFGIDLVKAINNNGHIGEIDLIGTHVKERNRKGLKYTSDGWYKTFVKFAQMLKSDVRMSTNVKAYYYKPGKWHAKICTFIPWQGEEWSIAIVGSSNMTIPVFRSGKSLENEFNVEADVTLWKNPDTSIDEIIKKFPNKDGVLYKTDDQINTAMVDSVVSRMLKIMEDRKITEEINLE